MDGQQDDGNDAKVLRPPFGADEQSVKDVPLFVEKGWVHGARSVAVQGCQLGWKFMSCSQVKSCVKGLTRLLIGCKRMNNQSEVDTALDYNSYVSTPGCWGFPGKLPLWQTRWGCLDF